MDTPFRLQFPMLKLPANKGGERAVMLWGEKPVKTFDDDHHVRTTCLTQTGKVIQLQMPLAEIEAAMRAPVSFEEVRSPIVAPNGVLFDHEASIAKKIAKKGIIR